MRDEALEEAVEQAHERLFRPTDPEDDVEDEVIEEARERLFGSDHPYGDEPVTDGDVEEAGRSLFLDGGMGGRA